MVRLKYSVRFLSVILFSTNRQNLPTRALENRKLGKMSDYYLQGMRRVENHRLSRPGDNFCSQQFRARSSVEQGRARPKQGRGRFPGPNEMSRAQKVAKKKIPLRTVPHLSPCLSGKQFRPKTIKSIQTWRHLPVPQSSAQNAPHSCERVHFSACFGGEKP